MKVESTFHPDLVIEVTMGVGPQGPKGDAYILTEDDKLEIGHMYDALKEAAEAAAGVSREQAEAASESADSAASSEHNAAESAARANAAMDSSEQSASEAGASAEKASAQASNAADSASRASQSAQSAEESALAASASSAASENRAAQSEASASESASKASASEANAASSASDSETAAVSAQAALEAAEAAQAAAEEAASTAQNAKTDAINAKEASEVAAGNSESILAQVEKIRDSAVEEIENAYIETINGTDPVIIGRANKRYVCGECYTLTVTPPSVGTMEVFFTSGSTVTVLNLPSTVIMPEWYGGIEENTAYLLSITDGRFAGVMTWAM